MIKVESEKICDAALSESVRVLQANLNQERQLVDKLDATIEKLTEVSASISRLLAVHGSRIDSQEKVIGKLQEFIEANRRDADKNIKDVYNRMEKVEKEIYKEIEATQERVLKEIKEMRAEGYAQHEELKNRVLNIDKWMWTMVGGLAVITLIIQIAMRFI